MLSKTLLSLATLAATALAAPLENLEARAAPPTGNTFAPSSISTYNVGTGAITCAPAGGLISKSNTNGGQDRSTLVTVTYPPAVAGKKCALYFYLDPSAGLGGSQKIDVFTSLNPAPGCTSSWPPGNQRNNQLGRLNAKYGWADWEWTSSTYMTSFTDCKAPGTIEGFELVGVYDTDYVSWNPAVAGVRIAYM
jgi:hypothetical protein